MFTKTAFNIQFSSDLVFFFFCMALFGLMPFVISSTLCDWFASHFSTRFNSLNGVSIFYFHCGYVLSLLAWLPSACNVKKNHHHHHQTKTKQQPKNRRTQFGLVSFQVLASIKEIQIPKKSIRSTWPAYNWKWAHTLWMQVKNKQRHTKKTYVKNGHLLCGCWRTTILLHCYLIESVVDHDFIKSLLHRTLDDSTNNVGQCYCPAVHSIQYFKFNLIAILMA